MSATVLAPPAGLTRRTDRLVLAALVLAGPSGALAEDVVDVVWGPTSRAHDPQRELRGVTSRLRARYGREAVTVVAGRLRWTGRSDLDEHQRLLATSDEGRSSRPTGEHIDAWRAACELWAPGGPLVELSARHPGAAAVVAARSAVLERLVAVVTQFDEIVPPWLERLLARALEDDHTDERIVVLLAAARSAAGDARGVSDAVRLHAEALAPFGLDASNGIRAIEAVAADPVARSRAGGTAGLLLLGWESARRPLGLDVPFVGRDADLEWLHRQVEAARDEPGIVVLAGRRGAGRTALLEQFAADARRAGHEVVWCSGSREPLAPMPLAGHDRSVPDAPTTVIVIDDADECAAGALTALSRAVRATAVAAVLVVLGVDHARLDRWIAVEGLDLDGADVRVVRRLDGGALSRVARAAHPGLGSEVIGRLTELAVGRPARVARIPRVHGPRVHGPRDTPDLHDGEAGDEAASVLEAAVALVVDEVAASGPSIGAVVDLVALAGGTIDRELAIAALAGLAAPDAIDVAVEAGLVTEGRASAGVSRLRVPALVAAEVRRRMGSWRAAVLHTALADALDAAGPTPDVVRVAAHRWAAGMADVGVDAAIDASIAAGRHAAARLDHAGAARWLDGARLLIERHDDAPSARLVEVLVEEGQAMAWAGSSAGSSAADATLARAVDLARGLEDPQLLAQALTVTGGDLGGSRRWRAGSLGELREVLVRLAPDDHRHRSLVLSRMAWLLSPSRVPDAAGQAATQAIDAAEASGDPSLMARAWTSFLECTPHDDDLAERLDLSRRLTASGRLLGDERVVTIGLAHEATARFAIATGDDLALVARLVRRLDRQHGIEFAGPARSLLRGLRGDLDGAEELVRAQLTARGDATPDDDTYTALLLQLASVLRWRGVLGSFFDGSFTPPTGLLEGPGQVAMAVALGELGQPEECRALLRTVLDDLDASMVAYPSARLVLVALGAEAAVLAHDADAAERLLPFLLPAAERGLNCSAWVHAWAGAASHHAGAMLALLGRVDEARAWLDAAEHRHRSLGAWPYLAVTHVERARLERTVARSARGGTRVEANTVADAHHTAALDLANRFGLVSVERSLADL